MNFLERTGQVRHLGKPIHARKNRAGARSAISESRVARLALFLGLATVIGSLVPAQSAVAVTVSEWAAWGAFTGTANNFSTTMSLPVTGFPTAQVRSDSRAGQVGIVSGASTWVSEGTPVGAKYGSSRNQPYLNLRPQVDNASSPSTTTYTFDSPTPSSGWTFVLGDIDADKVRVSAVDAAGRQLTAGELGFRGGFNFCAPGVVGKPSCTGDPLDFPTWDAGTTTLTGNLAADDTSGSSAWFEPSAPISVLTLTFTQRSGFPTYSTRFAALARDISGIIRDPASAPVSGVTVNLIDVNKKIIATTVTLPDGTYQFPGIEASSGYTAEVIPPAGKIIVGAPVLPADLSVTDAVNIDFTLRDVIPVPVSGSVADDANNPMPGVAVTLNGGGPAYVTTTNSQGNFFFEGIPAGDYTTAITVPSGYSESVVPAPFTIAVGATTPVTNQNFVLVNQPSVSGAVTYNGLPVAGVVVTISNRVAPATTAITGSNGSYIFNRVGAGTYTVAVSVPSGYMVDGPQSQSVTISDTSVADINFQLAKLGSISGIVTHPDVAVAPFSTIVVDGPNGQSRILTNPDGSYSIGSLPPGRYTATLVAPSGFELSGKATIEVVISSLGEAYMAQDFQIVAATYVARGTVTDNTGTPVGGVALSVTRKDGSLAAPTSSSSDGSWSVTLPSAGGYIVSVTAPAGYSVRGESSRTFDVVGAAVVDLDFVLEKQAVPLVVHKEPGVLAVTGTDVVRLSLWASIVLLSGLALSLPRRVSGNRAGPGSAV